MAISNDLSKGILFYDDAQDLLCVNYTDSNSPFNGWWTYTGGTQNTCNPQSADNNVSLTTAYSRLGTGKKSYRHFVKYRGPGNTDGQWGRGEWGLINGSDQMNAANRWYWSAMSTLIDPAHAFESRRYQIGFDHKENPDDLETPFWLGIWGYPGDDKNGPRYGINGRFVDANDVHGRGFIDLGPVVTGVWVDWVLERNWSTGNDGYMRFYKNGVKVWERLNQPNTTAGKGATVRVQQGFYKWAWYSGNPEGTGSGNTTGSLIMYSAEHKFGNQNATLADMMPGGFEPDPGPDPGPEPIPSGTIRINAGGKKSGDWDEDKYYSGGQGYSTNASIPEIYKTERFRNSVYTIPVSTAGIHTVNLHFAEIFFTTANARLFNVKINGADVLTNFDVFKEAGGANKPIVKTFKTNASVASGVKIEFISVKDNAKISGIEVVPPSTTPPPDISKYVKSVSLVKRMVDGLMRDVSVTTFNDNTTQTIEKKA